MTERAKGVLELYKEEMKLEMKEEMKNEYDNEMAKKLKDVISPEEIVKITGLSLKTVISL